MEMKPLPRRKHGVREPLADGESARATISKIHRGRAPAIELGLAKADPEAQALQRAALAGPDANAASAQTAAAMAVLLTYEIDPRTETTGEAISNAFVDHWIATRGATAASRAPGCVRVSRRRGDRALNHAKALWHLIRVPKAEALELFREIPAKEWYAHSVQELAALLSRFGLPGVDPILRFASTHPGHTARALEPLDSPRAASVMAHVYARVRRDRAIRGVDDGGIPREREVGVLRARALRP